MSALQMPPAHRAPTPTPPGHRRRPPPSLSLPPPLPQPTCSLSLQTLLNTCWVMQGMFGCRGRDQVSTTRGGAPPAPHAPRGHRRQPPISQPPALPAFSLPSNDPVWPWSGAWVVRGRRPVATSSHLHAPCERRCAEGCKGAEEAPMAACACLTGTAVRYRNGLVLAVPSTRIPQVPGSCRAVTLGRC